MTILEIIILSILQGLTEFLPISSSAHLILPSQILGWQDQGVAFDVAVHVGTLLAVVLYFRADVFQIISAWISNIGKSGNEQSRLGWWILLGTLPAIVIFPVVKKLDLVELYLRSAWVIATTTVVFGLLLWYADVKAKQVTGLYQLTWKQALYVGLAQVLAVIPGTSRSGITITAGLMMGMDKQAAARFSFLLSIPIISGMGLIYTLDLATSEQVVDWNALLLGTVLSFVAALICIHYFLKIIEKMGMLPFVVYRLLLGVGLFVYLSI